MDQNQSKVTSFSDNERTPAASISLGKWNFYFIVKFFLYWNGLIGFHALPNLAFATFILTPVGKLRSGKLKPSISVLIGISLLYYDSWLPSIVRVFSQVSLLSSFDTAYLIELAGRFINFKLLLSVLIFWVIYKLLSPVLKLSLPVVLAMVAMVGWQPDLPPSFTQGDMSATNSKPGNPAVTDIETVLSEFYLNEATRSVTLLPPTQENIPFDIIFIHVCSLSWDDIRAVDLEEHSFWKQLDILFTRFNTAASYSGPAAIRFLRSTCGQSSNTGLYQPVADQCYLMSSLQRSGFEPNLAMNHDGHFDDFLQEITKQKLTAPTIPLNGMSIHQHAFDGAPIYDDFVVLQRWLEIRQQTEASRVALYYNTVSLHDGNRLEGVNSKLNSIATYKLRLNKFLDDLDKFMRELEISQRRAVVVIVPEHGAAIRGDKMQFAGLREIPSPSITLVPVGIKVIGDTQRNGSTLLIDSESSYLAVSTIVEKMLENSPFNQKNFNPKQYTDALLTTPFVAQNESAVTMKYHDQYYWRQDDEKWGEYR